MAKGQVPNLESKGWGCNAIYCFTFHNRPIPCPWIKKAQWYLYYRVGQNEWEFDFETFYRVYYWLNFSDFYTKIISIQFSIDWYQKLCKNINLKASNKPKYVSSASLFRAAKRSEKSRQTFPFLARKKSKKNLKRKKIEWPTSKQHRVSEI